jgi:integrase
MTTTIDIDLIEKLKRSNGIIKNIPIPREHNQNYLRLEDVEYYPLKTFLTILNEESIFKHSTYGKEYAILQKQSLIRNQAIVSAIYLCGSRVTEICNLNIEDVIIDEPYLYITTDNLKSKIKRRKKVIVDMSIEGEIAKYFIRYYNWRKKFCKSEDEPLFLSLWKKKKYTRRLTSYSIYRICNRYFKFNPHFLRKLRASHLRAYYKFDSQELKRYMGWSSIISATPYLHVSDQEIMDKFTVNSERVKRILKQGVGTHGEKKQAELEKHVQATHEGIQEATQV